jgi:glyoxylase-like metal-dependent hydrolase (beta-lactamase superfamily II)
MFDSRMETFFTDVLPPVAVFPGGVGNTQQDQQRFNSLYNGLVEKIFERLPDQTWVYPGHGSDTTLGAERPHLQEWRERGW